MISRRKFISNTSATVLASSLIPWAHAEETYPRRPIKFLVGNPPGGTDDLLSRTIAQSVGSTLGQPIVVENKGGGSTTIAGATLAMSPPDGYNVLCLTSAGIAQTALRENLRYGLKDFAPIIGIGGYPLALTVSAESNINTLDELIAKARSSKGVVFANAGVGTVAHLTAIMFLNTIKGDGLDVAYKNNPEALQALAGGFADMIFASASEAAALRPDKKIKVIAVTSSTRAVNMPDVPTMAELGYPSINSMLWHGFVAPARTPPAIVSKLADSIETAVNTSAFHNLMDPQAYQTDLIKGAELQNFMVTQAAKWRKVIADNKISVTS